MELSFFNKKNKQFKKYVAVIFLSILAVVLPGEKSRGTITAVVLTPATPTILSNGLGYYLAGITYNFTVQVIDPDVTGWGEVTDVRVTIPNSVNIIVAVNPAGTGNQTITSSTGPVNATANIPVGDTFNNFTVTFGITFRWDTAESAWAASRNVVGSATTTNTLTNTKNVSYGVCAGIKVIDFAQSGDASDGLINPYYAAFNVTGTVVFNVPGATTADAINTVVPGELTAVSLLLFPGPVVKGFANGGTSDNFDFTITTADATLQTLGAYNWRIRGSMTTGSATEDTTAASALNITSDRVIVTALSVTQGGGRDAGDLHWRSKLVPGTLFTVTAQMQNSGGGMSGNTTFEINYNGGTSPFTVEIPSGGNSASVIIPTAYIPGVTAGSTASYTYYITRITGNSYGSQGDGTFGAPQLLEIVDTGNYPGTYYANQVVYWENADPPFANTHPVLPTTSIKKVTTATSLTIYWDVATFDTSTTSADRDFYEYRIYFREGSSGTFRQWDGDDDPVLRGLANNPFPAPVSNASLQFDANGWKYTTIPDLKIYTVYEFYIAAVDVFGNETSGPPSVETVRTQPYSIDIALSDGLQNYDNSSFADLTPTARPLRETNIKVTLTIVTSEALPDSVKVWYTTGDTSTAPDIVNTAANSINSSAFASNTLFSSAAKKTGPNTWVAYLSTQSGIIKKNNSIRFIVESSLNNVSSFTDSETEASPNQNPNDDEWTFYITTPVKLKPWPVRVLNNVITDKNPAAYPAYYLSEDANVTIRVYDIRGRAVATILDRAFRRGGQNIKEQGWRGINKAREKLGPGLYYIHFRAKAVRNGRVILNKFKKVVVAR